MAFNCVGMNWKLLLKITKELVQVKTSIIIGWAMIGSRKLFQWTLMTI